MMTLGNFIFIFPIYGQFGGNRKLDSGRSVCKTFKTFSLIVTLYLTKTENRIKKFVRQFSHHCFK